MRAAEVRTPKSGTRHPAFARPIRFVPLVASVSGVEGLIRGVLRVPSTRVRTGFVVRPQRSSIPGLTLADCSARCRATFSSGNYPLLRSDFHRLVVQQLLSAHSLFSSRPAPRRQAEVGTGRSASDGSPQHLLTSVGRELESAQQERRERRGKGLRRPRFLDTSRFGFARVRRFA